MIHLVFVDPAILPAAVIHYVRLKLQGFDVFAQVL